MYIYSHNPHSRGAKALARAMGIKRIKHFGHRFKGSARKIVINWGSTELIREVMKCNIINLPDIVMKASNKGHFFQALAHTNITPTATTSKAEAARWINGDGTIVVCRTVLQGHGGVGIVLARSEEELVDAPLYVKYVPKKEEYRIHLWHQDVFHIQRKVRRADAEPTDWQIRNHDNGFIYQRQGLHCPADVLEKAGEAMLVIGLDFGAVDVIYNAKQQRAYVLEINTAPGLEGASPALYAEMFLEKLRERPVRDFEEPLLFR